ncbi:brix domain-containing protein c [Histoplasma capsulatum G186AR]|uniref:Brix domain-containing protein c n=2 Tax=Ajellomyces capsulatus TaxID=5037 RepID=C0NV38_AJECG|nr:brix domain-containing protein c [Histoplasma capsulatum G186AR]EEH04851.1 brix domain-containing protein c [Histoplasma capsulatum G186AR]KAG5287512.1 brix domain-containing protein c [Histoplasma capsulatum]QSS70675.1 brix domain-containing protein c [Histoplasma capsulatum G186AR]
MAKRRTKKRTHLRAANASNATPKSGSASMQKSPKSMVIRVGAGEIGPSVSQLVKDVRAMMEPDTASRLKERKSNKLKDYTVMTGPLGVTHLLLFSKSSIGNTSLRLALAPRGPTLHFRIENYSLCKDVIKALKHPKGSDKLHRTHPLLVMNNFMSPKTDDETPSLKAVPKHLESLTTTVFQSLFPPISPQTTPFSSIRRIILLNRELSPDQTENGSYVINLRHYAITTKRIGIPKRIRRLDPKEQRHRDRKTAVLPNLGKLDDVADYLLDPSAAGYTSASETELDTDAEVEVMETTAKKVLNKRQIQRMKEGDKKPSTSSDPNVEKRAVKLVELGPRMKLKLTKVEEGLCSGKVLWHHILTKSEEETRQLDEAWEKKRREKEQRRKEQKEAIERKRKERGKGAKDVDKEGEDEDLDEYWDSEDFDDVDEEMEDAADDG